MKNSYPQGSLLSFYSGQSPDRKGRLIVEIWTFDYVKLEVTHDYIQWLFPLRERSNYNLYAPILQATDIKAFHTDPVLRKNLLISLKLMLTFYGLKCNLTPEGKIEIIYEHNYTQRKKQWLCLRNHNYLRLTRILSSLCLLGFPKYAIALFNCLKKIYQEEGDKIGETTFYYWQNAIIIYLINI